MKRKQKHFNLQSAGSDQYGENVGYDDFAEDYEYGPETLEGEMDEFDDYDDDEIAFEGEIAEVQEMFYDALEGLSTEDAQEVSAEIFGLLAKAIPAVVSAAPTIIRGASRLFRGARRRPARRRYPTPRRTNRGPNPSRQPSSHRAHIIRIQRQIAMLQRRLSMLRRM